jgi:hypothetical protein
MRTKVFSLEFNFFFVGNGHRLANISPEDFFGLPIG